MIREGVSELLKRYLGVEEIPFNVPPRKEMGDFSSAIALSLAKEKRRPPIEMAKEIIEYLNAHLPPFIKEVTYTPPGYINFKVDWPKLAKNLIPEILKRKEFFGKPVRMKEEKIFIEHTSVNPNKAMHIGHLRNSVLGDTVARILRWLGYTVEVCNYIDDTGVQVVDVITALLYLEPPFFEEGTSDLSLIWRKVPLDQSLDYYCWDLYARFQSEMERNPSLLEKREKVLHLIEKGEPPISLLAKELATKIVQSHLETVYKLSIYFNLLNWESDIIRQGFWEETFELLKQKKAIRYEEKGPNEGCWVVPMGGHVETEEGIKSLDKILVRSNGSITYTGKDIAYQLWKFGLLEKDFLYKIWERQPNGEMLWTTSPDGEPSFRIGRRFGKADRVINVIDVRQSYPQQVVMECLRQMGFEKEAEASIHLAYEVVNLSAQAAQLLGMNDVEEKRSIAMSGRLGTGIKAKDFIEIMKRRIIEKSEQVMEEGMAEALANSAIRYYLLKYSPESQIIFDFDEALKTTGDTGVYLEYAHARACSILRKAEERGIEFNWTDESSPNQLTETERNLLDALSQFPKVVERVGKSLRVSQFTEYAFHLATSFTNFYEHPDPGSKGQTPFIHLQDPKLRTFRLSLVRAFQYVMANTLTLMGMPTLERI
ncbi:MAG: arginine--tRNA ligase [Thermodesulfobacteriota bacterium]